MSYPEQTAQVTPSQKISPRWYEHRGRKGGEMRTLILTLILWLLLSLDAW